MTRLQRSASIGASPAASPLGSHGHAEAGRAQVRQILRGDDGAKPGGGRALIEALGGTVESGAATDAMLGALGARAATHSGRVQVRSDVLAQGARGEATLAHEAVHLIQQGDAPVATTRMEAVDPSAAAEREAHRGAEEIANGRAPEVRERVSAGALQLELDADADFEPGTAPEAMSLDRARRDPLWVERDIANFAVSDHEPWTFTVLYQDRRSLEIPLTRMSFKALDGATITFFRRHRRTGRLIPFQIDQLDPGLLAPSAVGGADTLFSRVPARFDPRLTPLLIDYLNQAQMLVMGTGMLKVLELQLMNPLVGGGSIAAEGAAAAGTRLGRLARAGRGAAAKSAMVDAEKVAAELFARTAEIASPGARMLRFGALLSKTVGPTAAEKVEIMIQFFRKIGFAVGKQGVIDEGASLLMHSEDGRYAFRFIKETGKIIYGKFDMKLVTYTWNILE